MTSNEWIDPERGTPPGQIPKAGPSAHEDLTIAEHIANLLAKDEHRPNERGCLDEDGKVAWLPETEIRDFIREHGALHPSDYLSRHGRSWEKDLFSQPKDRAPYLS